MVMRVFLCIIAVTSLRGSVDWNLQIFLFAYLKYLSLPSGEVWIEIGENPSNPIAFIVTSLRGSVDWNNIICSQGDCHSSHFPQGKCGLKLKIYLSFYVNLGHFPQGKCGLKSFTSIEQYCSTMVTSLRGSVDWNCADCNLSTTIMGHFPQGKCGLKSENEPGWEKEAASLPSGEVWIEIVSGSDSASWYKVTSLRGSVDWNKLFYVSINRKFSSLPSGEVWIEM